MKGVLITKKKTENYTIIKQGQLQELPDKLKESECIAINIKTQGHTSKLGSITGIGLSANSNEAYYIPLNHASGENITPEEVKPILKSLFKHKKHIAYNFKNVLSWLRRFGIDANIYADVMIFAYIDDASQNLDIESLSRTYLGIDLIDPMLLLGGRKKNKEPNFWELAPEYVYRDACLETDVIYRLYQHFKKKNLDQNQIYKLELALIEPVLAMEERGIKVDKQYLEERRSGLGYAIRKIQQEIYTLVKNPIELNSPQQVANLLYNNLKLPYRGFNSKTEQLSVSTLALQELIPLHPVVQKIITYRKMTKLEGMIGTFLESINPDTGCIHTSLLPTAVVSGRFASENPNLQNVPGNSNGIIVGDVREAFKPRDGYYFLSADYKNIEYKIVAGEAGEKDLIEAFNRGEDVHKHTAAMIFGVPYDKVDDAQRSIAKQIGFALIYGMSSYSLSKRLKLSTEDAKALLNTYFQSIPQIKKWIENIHQEVINNGCIFTHFGRRRDIPEASSHDRGTKAFGLRSAVNHFAQGTCADILKMAIVNLHKALEGYDIHPLLCIHDQILFEVSNKLNQEEIIAIIIQAMEIEITGYPPITVDITTGTSWGELKGHKSGVNSNDKNN